MCTIALLHRAHRRYPLIVAANRDELYERPATEPQLLGEAPRILAGVDMQGGGTWMGATDTGFFVGITNQRSWYGPDGSLRSRGVLALEVLRAGSVGSALRHLHALDPRQLNSFNMVFGGAGALFVAYGRRAHDAVEVHELGAGLHVLTNDRIGSPDFPKARRAEELIRPRLEEPWTTLRPALQRVLADHELPDTGGLPAPPPGSPLTPELVRRLQALCIHTPAYGTRSATLLALEETRVGEYWFAHGAPCVAPFEEQTAKLQG